MTYFNMIQSLNIKYYQVGFLVFLFMLVLPYNMFAQNHQINRAMSSIFASPMVEEGKRNIILHAKMDGKYETMNKITSN